jgi:hypothetical protein
MGVIRTLVWLVILAVLLAFSYFNWRPVEVQIWENLIVETRIPALVIVAFLLGFVPMWLLHRGVRWRLNRRISGLQNAARANSVNTGPAATGDGDASAAPAAKPATTENGERIVPENEKPPSARTTPSGTGAP